MRYRRFDTSRLPAETPTAAVWPAPPLGADTAPAPVAPAAEFRTTPAMADVPTTVGWLVAGVYGALILVFFALYARSPLALFSIAVCAFFVAMFFAVPRIFLAIEAAPGRRPRMDQFLHSGLATLTGRSTGRDALVQMLIVPVLLVLGLAAIGIIGRIFIP